MKRKTFYKLFICGVILCITLFFSCGNGVDEDFDARVKIAYRQVGNELLLTNQDSTSLIKPVQKLQLLKYRLSFSKSLCFDPDDLILIISQNFKKAKLPENYFVEVIQNKDDEVAYSFLMSNIDDKTFLPCSGRVLPVDFYNIDVKFTQKEATLYFDKPLVWVTIISLIIIFFATFYFRIKQSFGINTNTDTFTEIGDFQFYADQNKLIKEAKEISLSKKECELLSIFVAHPNQIIKRDELIKRVWEDNGVIVGRSLDTFISKLRKKLSSDETVTIENIHGVGYKLVVMTK